MNNHLFILRSQRPDFHDFYVFWGMMTKTCIFTKICENRWGTKIEFWHKKFVRLIAIHKTNLGTKIRENRWDTKLEFWHEKFVKTNGIKIQKNAWNQTMTKTRILANHCILAFIPFVFTIFCKPNLT